MKRDHRYPRHPWLLAGQIRQYYQSGDEKPAVALELEDLLQEQNQPY